MNSKSQGKNNVNPQKKTTLSQTKNEKDEKRARKPAEKEKTSGDKMKIDELKQMLEAKEAKLEEQLQKIEDLKEDSVQLKKKVDNLQLRNQIMQSENNDLKEETQKLKSDAEKADENINTARREAERQAISLSKKNNELREKITELEQKLENATKIESIDPEEMQTSASNFWINLYQEGGEFRGKIEHPFSKDRKGFTGIDQKIIIDFIKSHTPRLEESANGAVSSAEMASPKTPRKISVQPNIRVVSQIVRPREPIRLDFKLDLSAFQNQIQSSLTWNLYIFAKPLQGGKMQQISEFHEKTGMTGVIERQVNASALPAGSYRLESILTSNTPEGDPAPFSSSDKIGLLQVV